MRAGCPYAGTSVSNEIFLENLKQMAYAGGCNFYRMHIDSCFQYACRHEGDGIFWDRIEL